jgi:TonB family protein
MTGPAPLGRVSAAIAVSAALHTAVLAGAPGLFGPGPAAEGRAAAFQVRLVTENAAAAVPTRAPKASKQGIQVAAGPKVGLLEGPHYFRGSELDVKPFPLESIEPAPPMKAAGRVVARILINESGGADAVRIESSDLKSVFDDTVKAAFGAARYSPGIKDGRSVKSQMLVEVTFHGDEPAARDSAPAR